MNHTGLFLLPSLFYYTPDKVIKYCWNNKYKNMYNQTLYEPNDKPTDKQADEPTDESTDESTDDRTKFVFGILNRRIWNSKFDEKMSKTNFSSENSDELNKENNKIIECDDVDLNFHLFSPYMAYTVSTLLQNAPTDYRVYKESIELTGNSIKWDVRVNNVKIKLEVFKKINNEWESINTRIEDFQSESRDDKLIASSLFNNKNIVILTTFGILIYTFSENNKSIYLNYFYCMNFHNLSHRQYYKGIFSESTLPSSNSFELPTYYKFEMNGWVSDVINNKSNLLKYGDVLLKFAIKEHKLELINDVYKKCMTYFKEDLMNNKSFLRIITSVMPLLDEYYPEYILKYSSETNMIIDSSFYSLVHLSGHQDKNSHIYSFFQFFQIDNLSRSLLWTKYHYKLYCALYLKRKFIRNIIWVIQALIILLTLPLYLVTFYILSKYNFINDIYINDAFSFVYFRAFAYFNKITTTTITTIPIITFMIPYINFVNYSKDYNWFLELIKPQPSPFTETINRNIYKTWNGEALIDYKWNAYGKYYYAMIWILFMTLLGCFTAAATISQQYINEEVRQHLFIASVILGFIHLILEIRQFFYKITNWFKNFWNIFGKYKCLI
jgi:hypothetical protein